MQNINSIISECQSFIMDQALIIDDSKNTILNSWANKCLVPLATLLKRGKMRKFQINSDRKIRKIRVHSKGIHPTLAKILVIFATTFAVLLKTINYCISPDAREHLTLIRNYRDQARMYTDSIVELYGISNIMNIPYSEAGIEEIQDSTNFKETFTNYFQGLKSKSFRGCYTFGKEKYQLLAYKYNIQDDSKTQDDSKPKKPGSEFYIKFSYAKKEGEETYKWNGPIFRHQQH